MDFSRLKKGLFAVKETEEKKNILNGEEKVQLSYRQYGFQRAGAHRGSITGLSTCLQKIYQDFKQEIKDNQTKQDDLKRPTRVKIEEYKGNNERLEKKAEKLKSESIPKLRDKIEQLKEEKSHIRKNPQEVTGDDAGKASYYIGGVILLFLTVYLFIFYSSASYSAFFKEFSLNEIGVANSIFDAKALSKATHDGVTELALILTIPFVFLGLGYLIHKFQEQKTYKKFLKIAVLILVTFTFDAILAYEITEKIYNIKKENSFQNIPDFSVSIAIHSVNFWLIIFAGFIVYLIWGFVFDFVIEAHGKMDKVKVAIREKDKKIKDAEDEINDLETQIDKMNHTIDENNTQINKLNKILESTIVPREFEQDIYHFFDGWHEWMMGNQMNSGTLVEAETTVRSFIQNTLYTLETINPN